MHPHIFVFIDVMVYWMCSWFDHIFARPPPTDYLWFHTNSPAVCSQSGEYIAHFILNCQLDTSERWACRNWELLINKGSASVHLGTIWWQNQGQLQAAICLWPEAGGTTICCLGWQRHFSGSTPRGGGWSVSLVPCVCIHDSPLATGKPLLPLYSKFFVYSPWYNRAGWLGIKNKLLT